MRRISLLFLIQTFVVISSQWAIAQNQISRTIYRSAVDEALTVRKIVILPFTDNLQGIYSRPVEKFVTEMVDKNHHWELSEYTAAGALLSPDELENNPQAVATISQNVNADAFIAGRIIKGPGGIHIKVSMYLTSDKKLFAHQSVENIQRFQVTEVQEQTYSLIKKLLRHLPYNGLVLSRQGQRVTLNLGKNDGITKDQIVSVAQIIKTNRHPKFGFIISAEKEILGKIKILKIDDSLSFGKIVTEKEKGIIQTNSKITGIDYVTYSNVNTLDDKSQDKDYLMQRPDGQITFGNNPDEWVPKKPPTFGMVGASAGLGMYTGNVQTSTSLATKNPVYPSIKFSAELWMTPIWSLHANLRQGIISVDNPSGSSPSSLSQSLTSNDFLIGYNMRFTSGAWGPRVEVLGGFSSYKLYIDDTSVTGLTTKLYSGWKVGVSGKYPITMDKKWSAGANLFFLLGTKLSEKPTSSGSSDNSINQFGAYLDYKLGENLLIRGNLDFEIYSSNFSGTSVTSSSQRHTNITGGVHYLF